MKHPLILSVSGNRELAQYIQAIEHLLPYISLFIVPMDSSVHLETLPEGVNLLIPEGGEKGKVILSGDQSKFVRGGTTCSISYLYNPSSIGKVLKDLEEYRICGVYLDRADTGLVSVIASAIADLCSQRQKKAFA